MNLTLQSASQEFGVAKETIRSYLKKAGVEFGKGKTFTVRQCYEALNEKNRDKEAKTSLIEAKAQREMQKAQRESTDYASKERCLALIDSEMLPVRQAVLALATDVGHLCNPDNPALARQVLEKWVYDRVLIFDSPKDFPDA